ncbi:MAG: GmrSD restriction endonuclease domain-containing protein [Mycoplasma sp.]
MLINKVTPWSKGNHKSKSSISYEQKSLTVIIDRILDGKLKIPKFQRSYVWKDKQVVYFLNSMLEGQPFGFMIQWNDSLKSLGDSENHALLSRNEIFETLSGARRDSSINFIIDGQQRLTTLSSIFYSQKISNIQKISDSKSELYKMRAILRQIYFNLNTHTFEIIKASKSENNSENCIPLSLFNFEMDVESNKEFIKECKELSGLDNETKEHIGGIVGTVVSIFTNLQIGILSLEKHDFDSVIEIFNNINTKGKKLSIFEIINAKWHVQNVDLEEVFESLIPEISETSFKDIDNSIYLDSIYLCIDKNEQMMSAAEVMKYDLKSSNIDLNVFLKKFNKALESALDFLTREKFCKKTLPSEIIIKWLTYYYFKSNTNNIEGNVREKIIKYIALISLDKYYSSSTSSKLKKNIKFIDHLINGDESEIEKIFSSFNTKTFDKDLIIRTNYNDNSMIYKLISYLLYDVSSDLKGGHEASATKKSDLNMHHLFPKKAKLDGKKFEDIYDTINSIANLMPIIDKTNGEISSKLPSIYYEEFKKVNSKIDSSLVENYIDLQAFKNNDFISFSNSRAEQMAEALNEKFKLD